MIVVLDCGKQVVSGHEKYIVTYQGSQSKKAV